MSGDDRDRYVREVTAVAAPDARLLLIEFTPGGSIVVPGVDQAETERRFTPRLDAARDGRPAEPSRPGAATR